MYYLLLLTIAVASFNSILLKKSGVSDLKEVLKFNFMASLVWTMLLFCINGFSIKVNTGILLWGVIYGCIQALFILVKTLAMNTGPVSVTTLVGNGSLFVSMTLSVIIWKEYITLGDAIGLLALALALFLCTYEPRCKQSSRKWKYAVVLFLFASSGVGLVFKAFGKSSYFADCTHMMFIAALTMNVFLVVLWLFFRGRSSLPQGKSTRSFWIYAFTSGALSLVYNGLNIYVSANTPAVIFFPGFNGGVVVLSAVLAIALCREKPSKPKLFGLVLGTIAICIIGIF